MKRPSRGKIKRPARRSRKRVDAVIAVGKGRGFIIRAGCRHLVISAAHCLPRFRFPPRASISYVSERTYRKLLGAIGQRRGVSAECLFIDPIADIAVLASPDSQDLSDEADAYDRLIENTVPLLIAELDSEKASARLLPLDAGPRFACVVCAIKHGPLWIENAEQEIVEGMSGSPILDQNGAAIGVVVTPHGPQPRLTSHLPGWLIAELNLSREKKPAHRVPMGPSS